MDHQRCGTWLLASALAVMCVGTLLAQTSRSSAKCKPNDSTCTTKSSSDAAPAPGKSTASQFPFPEQDSKDRGDAPRTSLPEMPTTGVPDPPTSSDQPIHLPPGSSSSSGDDAGSAGGGSSSGARASSSSDDDDAAPTAAPSDAPVKASALKDLGSRGDTSAARLKLEQTRVADDLKIGTYYLQAGNAQGAYLRFKDAVEHAPDEPDARFGLAETSSRLNKRDEAALNYREYLRLDAGGDHDKAARKALGKLGGTAQ